MRRGKHWWGVGTMGGCGGEWGERHTWEGEGAASGILGRLSAEKSQRPWKADWGRDAGKLVSRRDIIAKA